MTPVPTTGRVVRPYGDNTGDGMVQVSFTLPVSAGPLAEAAAAALARSMGIDAPLVALARGVGENFTFFVVYGAVRHLVALDSVTVTERDFPLLSAREVNLAVRSRLGRKLVVVGACTGNDAHTVGIDAILSVKGFAGEKGLEYYREIRVVNLGAQVPAGEVVAAAVREQADAVLVSQVVTQRDAHLTAARELGAALRAAPRRLLYVVGGPRFDPGQAEELGADRVFGRGTSPREVASYLAHAVGGAGR